MTIQEQLERCEQEYAVLSTQDAALLKMVEAGTADKSTYHAWATFTCFSALARQHRRYRPCYEHKTFQDF
jgi:hypothetical protein